MIDGFFKTWVMKGSVIGEELSRTFKYIRVFTNLDEGLHTLSLDICVYDGEGDIDWGWDESDNPLPNIRYVCALKADLSGLQKTLKSQKTSEGQTFWKVPYYVNVLFGGTALKARLTWYEGVSVSRFHLRVIDIWLCLSDNLARRPCHRYSELSLLDHVCFPS